MQRQEAVVSARALWVCALCLCVAVAVGLPGADFDFPGESYALCKTSRLCMDAFYLSDDPTDQANEASFRYFFGLMVRGMGSVPGDPQQNITRLSLVQRGVAGQDADEPTRAAWLTAMEMFAACSANEVYVVGTGCVCSDGKACDAYSEQVGISAAMENVLMGLGIAVTVYYMRVSVRETRLLRISDAERGAAKTAVHRHLGCSLHGPGLDRPTGGRNRGFFDDRDVVIADSDNPLEASRAHELSYD